jgi:release factor glutamine methyltransferase
LTVREALQASCDRLRGGGVPDPELDSELLLRHALQWDRAELLASLAAPLDAEAESRFLSLVEQRAARRPLQHLTGVQHFWRREFRVTPDVLVPRPESELLVEVALEALRATAAPVVVDAGTGSGCLGLSIAAERKDALVHATDSSAAALDVARGNAERIGVSGRVVFHHGQWLRPVSHLAGRVDLVVSNPPYVDASELPGLQPEVRDHEPRAALVPPTGGRYDLYPSLAAEAARLLRPGGRLLVEVGHGMAERVAGKIERQGLKLERVALDLGGRPRAVLARAGSSGPL